MEETPTCLRRTANDSPEDESVPKAGRPTKTRNVIDASHMGTCSECPFPQALPQPRTPPSPALMKAYALIEELQQKGSAHPRASEVIKSCKKTITWLGLTTCAKKLLVKSGEPHPSAAAIFNKMVMCLAKKKVRE